MPRLKIGDTVRVKLNTIVRVSNLRCDATYPLCVGGLLGKITYMYIPASKSQLIEVRLLPSLNPQHWEEFESTVARLASYGYTYKCDSFWIEARTHELELHKDWE